MKDGYYWYKGTSDDQIDFSGEWELIEISNTPSIEVTWVSIMGSEMQYFLHELNGKFKGPLLPPNKD